MPKFFRSSVRLSFLSSGDSLVIVTPRRTRLVRVPDLHAFRRVVAASDATVVVPTKSAAMLLHGTHAVTRDELYDTLHARLTNAPLRLTALERDVIAQAAARTAAESEPPSFRLRPGLIAEMLRFYDSLRRQSQHVNRFEELIADALGGDDIDEGARRLRQQTRFLAAAFREYERRVRASGRVDEHILREHLIAQRSSNPLRHILVAVADWIADEHGLYVADFDLLSRIPDLETLDIVATDRVLASGFDERLHNWLPGLADVVEHHSAPKPVLFAPSHAASDQPWWTFRDREEELVAVARRAAGAPALSRLAVVYKQPLPYLYMAADVFGSARLTFRTFDAFPLAAQPAAAALDLVLESVSSGFTRDALIALLRSPHFMFEVDGREISRQSVSALDRLLADRRYLGDVSRLEALGDSLFGTIAATAFQAALCAARELEPLAEKNRASTQIDRLLAFWKNRGRPIGDTGDQSNDRRRARTAIEQTLVTLRDVHAAYDDPLWEIEALSLAVRRAIEEQTFAPESRGDGIRLLDDCAARCGDFEDVTIVGLVESQWPERPRRNIFYPPAVLKSLGWPSEKDRRSAADAHFIDLLGSARVRTTLSTFTLDDEALVTRSIQLDEVSRAGLEIVREVADRASPRVFEEEWLSREPVSTEMLDADARRWAEFRISHRPADRPEFHGIVAATQPRTWTVSALETYLGCPFRFFAQHVLKLEEEPQDEEVMDPRRQGKFVHGVFEQFFDAWQKGGRTAITPETMDDARELFEEIVEKALGQLPEAEAGLERTRLIGSPAAAGLGEAVIRMEAERETPVVKRLLEHPLEGVFTFRSDQGRREVAIKGKADRIDVLADGTFRLIDYKLGWPPDRNVALQLPIYAACAEQRLRRELSEACYIAFKGPRRVVPLFKSSEEGDETVAKAEQRLLDTIDRVARGEFPPTPDDVFRCETCSYGAVCRKDYVGDV